MKRYPLKSLLNTRMLAVLLTSFASGFPLALSGQTLQAWYTKSHVDIVTVGALTLVGFPYLLKVFWAPLMERFIPLEIGKRKSWLVIAQVLVALSLLIMAYMNPAKVPHALAVIAVLLAFFSASQDIVVDAYRSEIAEPDERGMAASLLAVGYRLAMLVSGAVALVMAYYLGWRSTYVFMAVVMLAMAGVSVWIPPVPGDQQRPATLKEAVVEPFGEFLKRNHALLLLLLMVSYKMSEAMVLALNTNFFLNGMGFSLVVVGSVAKIVGTVAVLLGGVVGGVIYQQLGLYRSLMYFGGLQMASNLLLVWLAVAGKSYWLLVGCVFGDYFCGGMATIAFVAFLMQLCHRRYTATQYALFSALAAVGRVLVGPLAGELAKHLGWPEFWVWSCFFGIPGLWVLKVLQRRGYFKTHGLSSVRLPNSVGDHCDEGS